MTTILKGNIVSAPACGRLDVTEHGYLIAENGVITGYSSFGDWRAFDGFRHTVEHSVYVHPDHQGKGIGRMLMKALIIEARDIGKHVMVAGIEAQNHASIHLHQTLGFVTTGQMPQVGTKFGRWLDLTFMQLQLDERSDPDAIK